MKTNSKQQGIGLIGLVIALSVVAAISFLAWNFYQSRYREPAKTPASGQTNEGTVSPIDKAENLENSDKFSE